MFTLVLNLIFLKCSIIFGIKSKFNTGLTIDNTIKLHCINFLITEDKCT